MNTGYKISYSQCWEDPDVLIEGLNISEKDTVLSIASGGDNTFAMLLKNPKLRDFPRITTGKTMAAWNRLIREQIGTAKIIHIRQPTPV